MLIQRRFAPAFLASLTWHIAIVATLWLATRAATRPAGPAMVASDRTITQLVWLNDPGPGGGGGGGGNRMTDPPRRAKLPGNDAITVPASKPRALDASKPVAHEQEPVQHLTIPVVTLAAATDAVPGKVEAPPGPPTPSQGPGDKGGAGTGTGPGDGPGGGRGLGRGRDYGMDGGPYRPGNGVTQPIEIRKGTPQYTADAMRARIQGSIIVECVVQTNGVCANIHVTRSFDPAFGLDVEAVKAAGQWRFRPGTRGGEPVPVRVTMEIAFALR